MRICGNGTRDWDWKWIGSAKEGIDIVFFSVLWQSPSLLRGWVYYSKEAIEMNGQCLSEQSNGMSVCHAMPCFEERSIFASLTTKDKAHKSNPIGMSMLTKTYSAYQRIDGNGCFQRYI